MLKKYVLILGMACGFFPAPMTVAQDKDVDMLVVAGATAVAVGTAVYVARRETNEAKINRAYKLIDMYGVKVQSQLSQLMSSADVRYFLSQSLRSKKEILSMYEAIAQLYREIDNRYNCWVTPWNWTRNMKQAFDAIKKLYQEALILKMMIDHAPLLQVDHGDEQALVKAARVFSAGTLYPVIYTVMQLQADMRTLRSLTFYIPCEYAYVDSLDNVVHALKCSEAYLQDLREQAKHEEQQRLIHAAQQQAQAQQSQACAQMRQAAALEERNEIERNK